MNEFYGFVDVIRQIMNVSCLLFYCFLTGLNFWFGYLQKIMQLLNQIAQMNELLLGHHKVLASKLAN